MPTNPSTPSIKLIKLIIPVAKNIIKKMHKKLIKKTSVKFKITFVSEKNSKIIDVIIWMEKRYFLSILYLSSKTPIIPRGKQYIGIKFLLKDKKIVLNINIDIPPPKGIGFLCKLLSLG